jgi:hypothetical protein
MYKSLKTCTATFYSVKNYGAFLQAFALQQFLGESNSILNYVPISIFSPNWHSLVGEKGRRKLPFFWRIIALYRFFRLLYRLYYLRQPFADINMLKLSRKYFLLKDILKDPPSANVYIAG